jgi:hypothetical protein
MHEGCEAQSNTKACEDASTAASLASLWHLEQGLHSLGFSRK